MSKIIGITVGTPMNPNKFGGGEPGKSAYEIAVENGFEGDEQEWLESLRCDISLEEVVEIVNQKDAAISEAKKAGDDAQADVDKLESLIGEVETGKTLVEMIAQADGAVKSVNGKTGHVELAASDVGAATLEDIENAKEIYIGSGEAPENAVLQINVDEDGEVFIFDPVSATDDMKTPVGIDDDGKLWTAAVGGGEGADGLTPYIGANGNWFIGEEDTGVKAAGKDGESGVYVGSDPMPDDCNIKIDPNGEVFDLESYVSTEIEEAIAGIDIPTGGGSYTDVVLMDVTLEEEVSVISLDATSEQLNEFFNADILYATAMLYPASEQTERGGFFLGGRHTGGMLFNMIDCNSGLISGLVPSSTATALPQYVRSIIFNDSAGYTQTALSDLKFVVYAYNLQDANTSWTVNSRPVMFVRARNTTGFLAKTSTAFGVGSQFKIIARRFNR